MRVLSKAVHELEFTWSPPEEPVRSKLDSWYFRSTRKVDSRASVPLKTWSAPQSARVHSTTQAIFSHVDGSRRPSLRTCILKQERPYAQTSAFSRSHAGPPPTSLIKLMPLMARRCLHCTPWQCCRFFKRNSCRRWRTELSLRRL